jgi:hypothetical protein
MKDFSVVPYGCEESNDLSACPFCGGAGQIKKVHIYPREGKNAGQAIDAFFAICVNWNCVFYHANCFHCCFTKEEAIAAWNRRAPDRRTAPAMPPPAASEARSGQANSEQPGEQWTQEPPSEEGFYWQWKKLSYEALRHVTMPRTVRVLCNYAGCLVTEGGFAVDEYVEYFWQKIPVPALPEEGGGE